MVQSHRGGGALSPTSALQLPDNLGARCSLLYAWDEEFTIRALKGYLQFMELKANFEDWDCEQLASPVVIDLVWQQHLLYNKQYNMACKDYCGQVIGYDPDASLLLLQGEHQQEQKVKTTKIALKALFGRSFDGTVWSFQQQDRKQQPQQQQSEEPEQQRVIKNKVTFDSVNESGAQVYRAADEAREEKMISRDDTISDTDTSISQHQPPDAPAPRASVREQISPKTSSTTDVESVTVKIKCFIDGKTQDTCIRVKRTTKMKKVEDCLAKLMNLAGSESVRFMVDGEQVSPWETLESMKVVDPELHWFTVMPKVAAYQ